MYTVKFDEFSGPLDLLLSMIEEEKLDITKVSLAKIAEDYLRHLENTKLPPEDLADFLVVASKLLFIKSRALFPQIELDEDGISLESQLKLLKLYHDASKQIEAMIAKKQFVYFREKMPVERVFRPPQKVTASVLKEMFENVIKLLSPLVRIPKNIVVKAISIGERIESLRHMIIEKAMISFRHFTQGSKDRTEVIVSFLAMLELCKQRIIQVRQDSLFQDIVIEKHNEEVYSA